MGVRAYVQGSKRGFEKGSRCDGYTKCTGELTRSLEAVYRRRGSGKRLCIAELSWFLNRCVQAS